MQRQQITRQGQALLHDTRPVQSSLLSLVVEATEQEQAQEREPRVSLAVLDEVARLRSLAASPKHRLRSETEPVTRWTCNCGRFDGCRLTKSQTKTRVQWDAERVKKEHARPWWR